MSTLIQPHIGKDAEGRAVIAGTTTRVSQIALDRLAHHWDADEMHRQYPHLGLSQIYSALAYYYDHQSEIEAEIEKDALVVQAIQAEIGDCPIRRKLLVLRDRT